MKQEIWEVEIRCKKNSGDHETYHVSAHTAAKAEKKALGLSKKNSILEKPYCQSAKFVHYVDA